MQDLSSMAFQSMKNPGFPEQEQLKCPRCDSTNTKFCYYNNYNLSQPRHFCKNCRRYWTKGGALRNIPVGGGTRKNNKRSPNTKRANLDPTPEPQRNVRQELDKSSESVQDPNKSQNDNKVVDVGGGSSFSSLLMANGEFRSLFDGLNQTGSGLKAVQSGGSSDSKNFGDVDHGGSSEYLQSGDLNGASSGWPDLSIFTNPGSGFQ